MKLEAWDLSVPRRCTACSLVRCPLQWNSFLVFVVEIVCSNAIGCIWQWVFGVLNGESYTCFGVFCVTCRALNVNLGAWCVMLDSCAVFSRFLEIAS